MDILLKTSVSLLPAFSFLVVLLLMDTYKLLNITAVLIAIGTGGVVALVAYFVSTPIVEALEFDWSTYSRYGAPVLEESLKGAFLLYLIRSQRIGFMVDAAIFGFAVGAGFAFVENLYYVYVLEQTTTLGVFIIRGFGTAIMHGGTTTIFGVISKILTDRKDSRSIAYFLPGFGVAIIFHSFYNHFFFDPVILTVLIVVTLPALLLLIFKRSERFLRSWLGVGFDTDAELLEMVNRGKVSDTKIGMYLQSVKKRFPGEVVFDMICLLKIHLELSLRAKGVLMMREAGIETEPDPDVRDKFKELRFLEKSIGRTGMLAISPFLHKSSQDLWQLHMLGKEVKS